MKILMVIFSILMIICGISCVATPIATFTSLGWLAGLTILIAGAGSIFRYAAGHNERSVWGLIGGICGVLFGAFAIINFYARMVMDVVFAYAIPAWVIVHGICSIVEAIKLKKINSQLPDAARTSVWLAVMIMGILIVLVGIAGFIRPLLTMFSIGLFIGVSVIASGIKGLAFALSATGKR